jgi:hypothetical protein
VWKKPQTADLEQSRDARIARIQIERQDEYVALLRRAAALRTEAGQTTEVVDVLIEAGQSEQRRLMERIGGRIFPRKRPTGRHPSAADSCLVFLDECGSHTLGATDAFPVFGLVGVVVREADWPDLDLKWREWKETNLGSKDEIVHEPDVRHGDWPFGGPGRATVLSNLRVVLAELDYSVVAIAIRRSEYAALVGSGPLDESLPAHVYLMSLDFLFERVVMVLDSTFNGGRARVVAESRGPKEDALLQYEFARLHLHGTSYISPAWFRQQLHPGITFESKGGKHSTGLQLADLVARPCAEKVANPSSTPDRWPEVRTKLCAGRETKNSILGLKILPWDDAFAGVWKPEAEGGIESAAGPQTDAQSEPAPAPTEHAAGKRE